MKVTVFKTPDRPIYYVGPQCRDKGRILILGNAYGIMPYQKKLAFEFAQQGFGAIWFPFDGQPGSTSGTFSIRSGAKNITQVIDSVNQLLGSSETPLSILAHCVSALITMEYLKSNPGSHVNKVIAYSLLAKPIRLKPTAENRLKQSRVMSGLDDWDWLYNPEEAITDLTNIPFFLCHIDDTVNRQRANRAELDAVAAKKSSWSVKSFPAGYDDNNAEMIKEFVGEYKKWLEY